MALRLFVCVFLLVVCLLFTLARLGRLDWFPLRPCIGYLDHPFKNKPVETEKVNNSLLANTDWSV